MFVTSGLCGCSLGGEKRGGCAEVKNEDENVPENCRLPSRSAVEMCCGIQFNRSCLGGCITNVVLDGSSGAGSTS